MDFASGGPVAPLFISTYSKFSILGEHPLAVNGRTSSSMSWGTANRALYIPLALPCAYPVRRVFWANGSIAGNMDLAIYGRGGERLYSTGSTAQTPTSGIQFVALTTPLLLAPGAYYIGIANDGTANRVGGNAAFTLSALVVAGVLRQASAFPLPDPMVPATFVGEANNVMPFCGITRTSSGF